MAEQALAFLEGQVLHLALALDVARVVAGTAQRAALLGHLERLRRGRRGVAASHWDAATGACTLVFSSFGCFELCGLWQREHDTVSTG